MEDGSAAVAAVEGMVAKAARGGARGAVRGVRSLWPAGADRQADIAMSPYSPSAEQARV
jgi:hypothetical protein